jgi:ppGpp synthetase/RelA/SpoT-type nucleotidyltranferase
MRRLTPRCKRFLANVQANQKVLEKAALKAKELVEYIVRDKQLPVHLVEARVKSLTSLRDKFLVKNYANPEADLTDLIGIRVITFFSDHVDQVAKALKAELTIDPGRSVDKRSSLGLRQFGYRSVHLISKLKASRARNIEYTSLGKRWFEIQVRSILEHAWAEIEHGVNYKAGIEYPDQDLRLLSAIAGTLEISDHHFLRLRERKNELIQEYISKYKRGKELDEEIDVARLTALLKWKYPKGDNIPEAACLSCLRAFKMLRMVTVQQSMKALAKRSIKRHIGAYAARTGLDPKEVSHLAIVILLTISRNKYLVPEIFPTFLTDPGMSQIYSRL